MARFALQRLGFDVWAVPTVLLSNHPGHLAFSGEVVSEGRMSALVDGLKDQGWLGRCDAVVSGYLGHADQAKVVADAVRRVKAAKPKALFLCDPVFGDDDGAYARPGVAEAMARHLLPLADIATPNRFELSSLTSKKLECPSDAVRAARLLDAGEVLATSVPCGPGRIGSMVVNKMGAWLSPAKRLDNVPSGTGDLLSALYIAARLNGLPAEMALQQANSRVHAIIVASAGMDELALVSAQDRLIDPGLELGVERVD